MVKKCRKLKTPTYSETFLTDDVTYTWLVRRTFTWMLIKYDEEKMNLKDMDL